MKKKLKKTNIVSLFSILGLFFCCGEATAASLPEARLNNPFELPQTSLFIGSLNYRIDHSNQSGSYRSRLDASGVSAYGFEVEVNSLDFLNIGAFFRAESQSVKREQPVTNEFATLLGGETRFFFVPPFLKSRSFTLNLFARLEAGVGPFVLGYAGGILGEFGAFVGSEFYLSKWIGFGISFGQIYHYGKETLMTGTKDTTDSFAGPYKNAIFKNQGQAVLFYLKTTYF